MKNVTTKLLSNCAVVQHFTHNYQVTTDLPAVANDLKDALDTAGQPVIYIADCSDLTLSFNEIVDTLNTLTQGKEAVFKHPNLQEVIFTNTSGMVELGAKALQHKQFGRIKAQIFASVEEALDYIESQT